MQILLVDDEKLARERLRTLLEEETDHQVIGEASNGYEALEKITECHPDVVFLDICMPGMDGLEVARHLMTLEDPPAVVFTTAYDEHALEAFQVHAVDYLLKPVHPARLKEALSKTLKPNKMQWKALQWERGEKLKVRTHVSARTRKGISLVPVADVYYFRAEHKYVTVRCKEGMVLIEESLKDLEAEFGHRFLRIHRNCLVATRFIASLGKDRHGQLCLYLRDIPDALEVSRRHIPHLRQIVSQGEF